MGQTLSEPLTTKHSTTCENVKFKVGSSSMQGWRVTMEDAHTHILELPEDNEASFFGVFDGHGGATISKHVASNLHKIIMERSEYKNGNIAAAIKGGFLEIDQAMQNDAKLKNEICGTTAVTCLIKGNKLYCGNVGDSRAIACVNGQCYPLSFDHKPNNPIEESRIRDAGGFVEYNRVNGNLALSRALGDFSFKRNPSKTPQEQMVCAVPDIEERVITEDWEFILLACDGIWDVLTNEEACEMVRFPLASGTEPDKVCEELLQTCLAPDCQMGGLGCDNMTAILICLLHGKSWENYCSKLANCSNNGSTMNIHNNMARLLLDDDSSTDDDEDAIPSNKLNQAKSVAASLCESLKAKGSDFIPPKPSHQFDKEKEELQDVMQAQDYVHQPKTGELEQNSQPADSEPTTIHDNVGSEELLGALNAEMFPNRIDLSAGANKESSAEEETDVTQDKPAS